MENAKSEVESLADELKDYINTSADLYKLKATEKGAEIASSVTISLTIVLIATMALLFTSFAAAYLISEALGKDYIGFALVAAFYLLVGIVLILVKDKWLKGTIADNIIKAIYNG